ncbi:MAG TPA: DUF4982 domain-containing protein, partial [Gemmataceae bacterium]|nr:DUF4982 domain-containing protein [Gemmataceae bacterium]
TSPVLYLTSRSYINRPTNLVDLKVYSNLSAVQLSINGVVIGTATSTDHIFRWSAVRLAPGPNDVMVTATGLNGTIYTDDVTWYAPMQMTGVPFARINFQPLGVPVPAGYVPDYGYVFGFQGSGLLYGWDSDNSANTFARGVMSDSRYDTGIAMEQPAGGHTWQIAVPNGTYIVHVVAGDPSNFDSVDEIAVQGVLTISGGVNILSRYQEAWRTVTVTNGLLTITNAGGSANDKLDFVDINQISTGSAAAPPFMGKGRMSPLPLALDGACSTDGQSPLSSQNLLNIRFGMLPPVLTDIAGAMIPEGDSAGEERQTVAARGLRSESADAPLEIAFDDRRPVLDNKLWP